MHIPENWKKYILWIFFILFFQMIKTKSNYNANSPYSVPKSVNKTQRKVKWTTFCGWKVNKIFFMNFFFILFSLYWKPCSGTCCSNSVSNKSYGCVDGIHAKEIVKNSYFECFPAILYVSFIRYHPECYNFSHLLHLKTFGLVKLL